jgi:diaminopimelate decarboxylase
MSKPPLERRLLPDTSRVTSDDIFVGGVSLVEIADTYGTPVFVYDEETLRARAAEAAAVFDEGTAFASKSFLCIAMARLAVEEGLCIDVSTAGELDIVLRAGVPADRIIVHGNNKSREELERAVDIKVRRLIVDNFDEIKNLAELVSLTRPLDVMLRVIPGVEAHTHEYIQTGQEDSKFGLSLSRGDADEAMAQLSLIAGVKVRGVHVHIGSQILDVESFVKSLEIIRTFVARHELDEVCIGGGLGVAYHADEIAPSLREWGERVRAAAREVLGESVVITAEPGRAITATAGLTLYRVGARKDVDARTYLAVDGGMSDNPRPILYGARYEAVRVQQPEATRDGCFRIVGKHCESGDVIIDEAWLPAATAAGDLIATPVTGAYGYSMASNYNRVPKPAVVFVRNGVARLVVRRETLDDLARLDV